MEGYADESLWSECSGLEAFTELNYEWNGCRDWTKETDGSEVTGHSCSL